MSRNVSAELKQAVYAQETTEAFIVLVTLSHPDLATPIRVNSSGQEVISNGDLFVAFPFEVILPDDVDDRPPRARLSIDNVSREIVLAIRTISSAPFVTIQIVMASSPSTIEAAFPDFRLANITYDQLTVEGDLTLEEFIGEPYPARVFSPADFPGLF
ncbi:MAG: DUF1833 family protein [Pseudomonadota bacterium]